MRLAHYNPALNLTYAILPVDSWDKVVFFAGKASMTEPSAFPSTRWSIIAAGGSGAAHALEHLAQEYWNPIARTLSRRLGRIGSDHDAEDLTQEFFVWLQQSDFLKVADPNRGRFRAFLQTSLRRFVIDQQRRAGAAKRGGRQRAVPLGDNTDPASCDDPGADLDHEWRRELIAAALGDLRRQFETEGKALYFDLFEAYFVRREAGDDYATLAARHNIAVSDVSNWLTLAKKRYRVALRARITETVRDPAALRDELAWFFGAESPA